MVTGVIKNKIDKIWTDIWAGGITNPLTVIEQLTYLMFIRSLDEKELENEEFANMTGETADLIFPQSEIGQAMRWSKFKDRDSREIFDLISQRVFPAVKKMKYGRLPDFNDKGETVLFACGEPFYATPGRGRNEVRLAYTINAPDIARAIDILKIAIEKYNNR